MSNCFLNGEYFVSIKNIYLHKNRTTKLSQKLALFPGADAFAEPSAAFESAAKGEADRPTLPTVVRNIKPDFLMNKEGKKWLPRVTAYCTAGYSNLLLVFAYFIPSDLIEWTNCKCI